MNTKHVIYILSHINFPNIIRYVGLTSKGVETRFKGHWKTARSGRKLPVYNWMRKHGVENISYRVVEEVDSREELEKRERFWIAHYRGLGQADLNLTDGGEGILGYKHSEEFREARRQYMLANPVRYEITDEHRRAVGNANRERLSTPEARAEHANKVGKLRQETVSKIKQDIFNGMTDREGLEKYGVSIQTISNIRHGNSWSHVEWPIGPWRKVNTPERPRGEHATRRGLTNQDVLQIRRDARSKTYAQIAAQYGVSPAHVLNIAKGKVWGHIPFEPDFPPLKGKDPNLQRIAVRGESNVVSKLNDEMVREARRRSAEGETYSALGQEFGVSPEAISNAVRRKTWKHVE